MKKLYKILGIKENASADEIKKAYRKLAKKYHPDTSSEDDSDEKFKEVSSAYEVLSDENKKREYDMYGDSMYNNQHRQNRQHSQQSYEEAMAQMFGHHFGHINLDKRIAINIPLEKAYNGGTITIEGNKINIPSNIRNGSTLRVRGKGHQHNGNVGDMFVQIIVVPSENWQIMNDDIITKIKVSLSDLVHGSVKEVDIFGETIKFKIPKDSKPTTKLRSRGKGLGHGDLIASLVLELPKSENCTKEELDKLY
jgi:curved DNA-binding protein